VKLNENVVIGLDGLLSHKLRSLLTALGIIFGVAAVIAMLSIGEGARQEALEQISLMGVNNIIIRAKDPTSQSFGNARANFSPGVGLQDGLAVREVCSFIQSIVPQWEKTAAAQYKSERKDVKVIGTTPEFLSVFNFELSEGQFLQSQHLELQDNVCVLGNDTKDQLFHYEKALGKQIKIDNQWFTVIGVMQRQLDPKKKVENLKIRNLNTDVYIPLTTAQFKMERLKGPAGSSFQFFGGGFAISSSGSQTAVPKQLLDQLTIKLKPNVNIEEATNIIQRIFQRRHYGVDDFEVTVPEALVQQSQQTQRIFNIVMGAIAGIALLVGGIGIMNIMLASVLERTKEIGIRLAVGATRADVLGQFLFEAVFLSVVGGLVGIALGFGLTKAITLYAEWRTVVSVPTVLLAFGVSAAVGIAFGYYPARKAALQNPIESLRYE
jgi:putative ABC transport system permease protein